MRCAGAPRDLGLDQGQAAREAIRSALRERFRGRAAWQALRELLPGSRSARAWRDLESYFPHHAERMLGLSLGARVPTRALVSELAQLLAGDAGLAAAVSGERAPGTLVARSFAPRGGTDLVLRHSAPDNDYRTLELASAWSVAATIGVNEHGLAASATALPAPDALLAGCAAPAALLVQDVLQRFDAVDKAVEWALRRPAGGHATLLLADAAGRTALVSIEGRKRRLLGDGEAFLVGPRPALGRRGAREGRGGSAPLRCGLARAAARRGVGAARARRGGGSGRAAPRRRARRRGARLARDHVRRALTPRPGSAHSDW